jgi:D-sedoheptulose 7-phosphate isomerase
MKSLSTDAAERVNRHIEISIATKQKLLAEGPDAILQAARLMAGCLNGGGKLMLCGNGGSAADAQHIAAEFVSTLNHHHPRPGMAAIALTTDTSFLTAHSNDFGFADIFARQVQALGRSGDALIGFSTSGNSKNVLHAMEYARANGIRTIALTGETGGKLLGVADITLKAPSSVTQYIQESHIMIGHILCDLVEQALA